MTAQTATKQNQGIDEAKLPFRVVKRGNSNDLSPRTRTKWIWRLLLAITLFACLAALFAFRAAKSSQQTTPAKTAPAKVLALGRLEPDGEVVSVSAPSSNGDSRIEKLNVREGESVHRNDILAVLDSERRLKADRDAQRKRVEQAREKIARTELEVRTTRLQLEASLASAEARLDLAKDNLRRRQRLLSSSATSREEYDTARIEFQTAQATVREAQGKLERYKTVEESQELVDIVLSRQDVAIAEASLEQAEANLEYAYVRAPLDGTILDISLRPGERIGQASLLEMGATHNMMARVEVYESDVPRIRRAQSVFLTAKPLEAALRGTVERISTLVKKQQIVDADPAANTDARVVEVWVRLDSESSERAARFVNLQVRAEFQP